MQKKDDYVKIINGDNMEEQININEFELIKEELLIKDMHKVVILDNALFNDFDKTIILDKIKQLEVDYIYNTIAYGIKVVESCEELLSEQAKKYDNIVNKLPLIILKDKHLDFIYQRELSKIKTVNDIMMELISREFNDDNNQYIILTKNTTKIIDEIIYISVNNFLLLDDIHNIESNHHEEYADEMSDIYFSDIIYTYLDIMKKFKGALLKEDEKTYIIRFKKYQFKVLLIDSYEELYNEEIELSNYDLIIEDTHTTLRDNKLLQNQTLLDIYQTIKPGKYFKE